MSQLINVDEDPGALGIVDGSGDVADLIANFENHLGSRIIAQLRLVNFQPQTLWALPEGDDLGLGEISHGWRAGETID